MNFNLGEGKGCLLACSSAGILDAAAVMAESWGVRVQIQTHTYFVY